MELSAAYVYDAIRTPFGRHGGALAGVRPDDLAAHVVRELLARSPELDPERIDDVLFGNANGAGEDNRNVARMAVLLAGLPTTVPGATVNRLCGSSLDAAMQASRAIETGDASVVLVGGVESMSRAPWVLLKPERGYARTSQELYSTTLGWRMVNPEMPEQWTISLGESAEKLADDPRHLARGAGRVRGAQPPARGRRVGRGPLRRLGRARAGRRARARRGHPPRQLGVEKLASAQARVREGRHGHGRQRLAAQRRRGARCCSATRRRARRSAASRWRGSPAAAAPAWTPTCSGSRPSRRPNRALERAGIGWGDIVVAELNEAFASQSLACLAGWPELDPERLNVNGGAIAIGHPLGASGVRILGTLAHELRRRGGGYGVASICIGVGQGLAVVLEA